MTDEQIIKHIYGCENKDCRVIVIFNKPEDTIDEITIGDIADVINRQQAEIERLNDVVELLQKHNRTLCMLEKMQINHIKSEAIKEVQNKLVERFEQLEHSPQTNRKTLRIEEVNAIVNTILQVGVPDIIKKVVKEMVGEGK